MAERGWFLDIVQECVNYELKLGRLGEELRKVTAELELCKGGGKAKTDRKISEIKKKLHVVKEQEPEATEGEETEE